MLSTPHLIILFIVVLIVFGPQKLPELARNLGKIMAEFRRASTDFRMAFEEEMRNIERQAREAEWKKAQAAATTAGSTSKSALPEAATSASETPAISESADPPATQTSAKEVLPVISPVAEAVPRSSTVEPPIEPAALASGSVTRDVPPDHE